jgi:hypothetical protein
MIIGSWKVIPASRPGMFQIPGTLVQPVIKTAKARGLTVPSTLLARTDGVID